MNEKKHIGTWSIVWRDIVGIGIVAAFVMAIINVPSYIKNIVKETVTSEEFVREVASHVRPSLLFDENGSILADQGATQYISPNIQVERVTAGGNSNTPIRIVISPNQHLAYPPLLENRSGHAIKIDAKRGEGFQWIYELHQWGWTGERYIFHLEIVK